MRGALVDGDPLDARVDAINIVAGPAKRDGAWKTT